MNNTGKRYAQRQAFAIVRSLESRLQSANLSESALWQWVLDSHKVDSRKELTERQWVVLSARLFAAQRNSLLFDTLCDSIRQSAVICRVYRRQNNGKFIRVYEGVVTKNIEERCQKHADAAGCNVELHNADGEDGLIVFRPIDYKYDTPLPPIAPVDKTTPSRIFEVHFDAENAKRYIEIRFPDTANLRDWCYRYVSHYDIDIVVTDQLGKNIIMGFRMEKGVVVSETMQKQGVV